MKLTSIILVTGLLLAPCAALAGKGPKFAVPPEDRERSDLATLVLPESLDVEMVDGFVYPGFKDLFRRGDIEVRILPGEREVALKYNQLFEWDNDQHEVVRSKTIVLGFTAQPGKVYRAEHDRFRTVQEARKGVENFVIRVLDEQGVNQVFGAAQTSRNWKGEEITMKRRDLVAPDAAAAALATRSVAAPAPAPAVTTPPASGGLNALDLLKFSWQNASEADRAAFRAWIDAPP